MQPRKQSLIAKLLLLIFPAIQLLFNSNWSYRFLLLLQNLDWPENISRNSSLVEQTQRDGDSLMTSHTTGWQHLTLFLHTWKQKNKHYLSIAYYASITICPQGGEKYRFFINLIPKSYFRNYFFFMRARK